MWHIPQAKSVTVLHFKSKKKEGKGGLLQIPLNGEAEGVSHSLKWQHTTQLLIDLVFQHHMTKLP